MPSTSLVYRAAARLGAALAPALGRLQPKMGAGHRGRRGAVERISSWAETGRRADRPLAWFHASSVGEGLQAESVLLELHRSLPEVQLVYTHFSPSAEGLARRLPVDVADYLPYDLPAPAERLLEALAPDLLVFSKLDLWPELATRADRRGTKVAIVAGTVSPGSGRLRWPARPLLRPGYRAVAAAAAISADDAARLAVLGVSAERIQVLGDPRFDSVEAKVKAVSPGDPLLSLGRGAPTLVAGSTWPPDEALLLQAYAGLRARHPEARLIVVPHEPTAEHLAGLDRAATVAGLPQPVRLSQAAGPAPLLVVDRVGALAALYGTAAMAYVGGGFGRAGLHSVLEPAAWGLPVAFGPRWQESRDAALLLEAGAAQALPAGTSGDASAAMLALWDGWISDDARRAAQGRQARATVTQGLGAAARSAAMLASLISSRHPRTSPTGAPPVPR
jgi:3-deoxy-D-manno-octulosonic-acid transferase